MRQLSTEYHVRAQMFATLYEDYQKPIERYLKTQVFDQEQASDLCQETFKQLWEFLCKETVVKQYVYYRNWLYKTATCRAIDYLRQKKPMGYLSMLDSEAYPSYPELSGEEEAEIITRIDLRKNLAQMPLRHQQIVRLIDQGYEQKDIAARLGKSASTVSEILRDVKTQLQPKYYPAAHSLQREILSFCRDLKEYYGGLTLGLKWVEVVCQSESRYEMKQRIEQLFMEVNGYVNRMDNILLKLGIKKGVNPGDILSKPTKIDASALVSSAWLMYRLGEDKFNLEHLSRMDLKQLYLGPKTAIL